MLYLLCGITFLFFICNLKLSKNDWIKSGEE